MSEMPPSERTRVRLAQELGTYDMKVVHEIIDAAPTCQVSTIVDDAPYVQTTAHWRMGDDLYIHGAVKNKAIHAIVKGAQACLSFSHFDGYVLTRSAFNHTILYRSVIAYSTGRLIDDLDEKRLALAAFIERIEPGRWETIRQPTTNELKQTGVIAFSLGEASGKVMSREVAPLLLPGGVLEDPADADVSPWTGIRPFVLSEQDAIASDRLGDPS